MTPKIKSILKYSFSTYFVQILNIFSIFIIPNFLSPVLLGKYNFLQLFYGYMNYSHFGIRFGLDKKIPTYIGKKQLNKAKNIANIGFIGIMALNTLINIIVLSFLPFFNNFDKDIVWGLIITLISATFLSAATCLRITLRAHEEISKMSQITISTGIILVLSRLLGVATFGYYGILTALLISNILGLLIMLKVSNYKINFNFDFLRLKFLLKAGFPFFVYGILAVIFRSLDKLVITKFLSFQELGYYSIGTMIVSFLFILPGSIDEVLFPGLLKKISVNIDSRIILDYLTRYMLIASKIAAIMIGSFIIFIPFFISYFLPKYKSGITSAQILLLISYPIMFQGLFIYYLYGINKHKLFVYPFIIGIIFFIAGTILLLHINMINLIFISILMVISTFLTYYAVMYAVYKEISTDIFNIAICFMKSLAPLYLVFMAYVLCYCFKSINHGFLTDLNVMLINEIVLLIVSIPLLLYIKKELRGYKQ